MNVVGPGSTGGGTGVTGTIGAGSCTGTSFVAGGCDTGVSVFWRDVVLTCTGVGLSGGVDVACSGVDDASTGMSCGVDEACAPLPSSFGCAIGCMIATAEFVSLNDSSGASAGRSWVMARSLCSHPCAVTDVENICASRDPPNAATRSLET